MTLTENETKVLAAIKHNFFGDGVPGAEIWSDCINDSAKPSGIEGKALSGVCASLVAKKLAMSYGKGRDACIRLTNTGIEAARDA